MMNETKPQNLIIPLALVEAIGNYLVTKPYGEVWQLIQALQQLQPAPDAKPETAKDKA
jgi:hypothetical protein